MSDILKRLENWGRYYRPHYQYQTCGSLEGAYRAPWRQWVPLCDIPMREAMDVLDAQEIEKAWQAMSSRKHKEALKYHFVYSSAPHVIARKAHCRVWQVQELIGNAISAIQFRLNLLTIPNGITSIDHNLKPGNRDFCP